MNALFSQEFFGGVKTGTKPRQFAYLISWLIFVFKSCNKKYKLKSNRTEVTLPKTWLKQVKKKVNSFNSVCLGDHHLCFYENIWNHAFNFFFLKRHLGPFFKIYTSPPSCCDPSGCGQSQLSTTAIVSNVYPLSQYLFCHPFIFFTLAR